MKRCDFSDFFRVLFQLLPHPFRGVETDKIINSEVTYEQANYNQTALIKASKRNPNARKMQTKEKTSRDKKSTYKQA